MISQQYTSSQIKILVCINKFKFIGHLNELGGILINPNILTESINENLQDKQKSTNNVKRGGCLSAFLIAMFIINPVVGLFYIIGIEQMTLTYPNAPQVIFFLLAIITLVNVALAIATWHWKKIGVYGFWATATIALIINLSLGLASWTSLLGFMGPIILTLLVRPKWSEFK